MTVPSFYNFSDTGSIFAVTETDWKILGTAISGDGLVFAISAANWTLDESHVRVFDWDGTRWSQRGAAISGLATDSFGEIIQLSSDGSVIAIGARAYSSYAGQIHVYSWNGSYWEQRGGAFTGVASYSNVGNKEFALSSDGSRLVFLDPYAGALGTVYTYDWNGTSWVSGAADLTAPTTAFTYDDKLDLSTDGTVLVVGNTGANSADGEVRVYDLVSGTWTLRGSAIVGASGSGKRLGVIVSLSGDGKVVLAMDMNIPYDTYVYAWDGSSWVERASAISPEADTSSYVFSAGLSSDGSVIVFNYSDYDSVLDEDVLKYQRYAWDGFAYNKTGPSVSVSGAGTGTSAFEQTLISTDGNALVFATSYFFSGPYYDKGAAYIHDWDGGQYNVRGEVTTASASASVLDLSTFADTVGSVLAEAVASVYDLSVEAGIVLPNTVSVEASANKITSSAFGYYINRIVLDEELKTITLYGGISREGDAAITQTHDYRPEITGDIYIVVNLRTKTHTTYRDGVNIAAAKLGVFDFGTAHTKTVTDAYLLARSGSDIDFVVKKNEASETSYQATFEQDGRRYLRNKKIPLAKGAKGTDWQFEIIVPENSDLYLKAIDFLVAEHKRRV